MAENSNQPRRNDVVLGGQAAMPTDAIVLGGLEGIRHRLRSPNPQQRTIALSEALEHGQRGLNLVIRALGDRSAEVRQAAFSLLQDRTEAKAIRALEQFQARTHYARLHNALIAQNWKLADQETRIAMLEVYGLSAEDHLQANQISAFPGMDLRVIDQLWTQYSRGRFGFSVQKAIWDKYYKRYWDKSEVWRVFADRVGWRVDNLLVRNHWKRYHEVTFSLNAPPGHLPFLGNQFGIFTIEAIANRLANSQV